MQWRCEHVHCERAQIADLVLLDADPVADIANIRRISMIIKDGVVLERDRLPLAPVYYRPAPR